jgi:uncharacterized membrane protein
MSAARSFSVRGFSGNLAQRGLVLALHPMHALIAAPSLLFLGTLSVMLFRPPDIPFYSLDRVAFGALIFIVLLRALTVGRLPWSGGAVTWPLLGLMLLALTCVMTGTYQAETWSVFAAKWVVPFAMYQAAGMAFDDPSSQKRLETFALIVLAYLSLTAIAFLLNARDFVFPRYILD